MLEAIEKEKFTLTVTNNGLRFVDTICIRFQGTNEDKTLTLENILLNGEKVKVEEVVFEGRFLGYDVYVDLAEAETIKVTADIKPLDTRDYKFKTVANHSNSSTIDFIPEEKLEITQELVDGVLKVTVKNVGPNYYEGLQIRFQGTNEDKSLTLANFMAAGVEAVAKEVLDGERFLGYDVELKVEAGKEVVLTADAKFEANREYTVKTLTEHCCSSSFTVKPVDEKLDIQQEVKDGKVTITIQNIGLKYIGSIYVRFQGSNEDKALTLLNFLLDGKEVKVTERIVDERFLGYDFDVTLEEDAVVVLTADLEATICRTYKFKTLAEHANSSTIEYVEKEKLHIEQKIVENRLMVTVSNEGALYEGILSIRFQGTNEDKAFLVSNIKLNGVPGEVIEVITSDGKYLGYDVNIKVAIGCAFEADCDIRFISGRDLSIKSLTTYCTSETLTIPAELEKLDIVQEIASKKVTITITNNGLRYVDGIKIRFEGTNKEETLKLTNFRTDGVFNESKKATSEDGFLGYDVMSAIPAGATVVITADLEAAPGTYSIKTASVNCASTVYTFKVA